MDWAWLFSYLQGQWAVIAANPLLSVLLVIIGIAIGYLLTNQLHEERFKLKDERIADYAERLALVPREGKHAKLTNSELRQEGEDYIERLEHFRSRNEAEDSRLHEAWLRRGVQSVRQNPPDMEAMEREMLASWDASSRRHREVRNEFMEKFEAEGLNLSRELLRRLGMKVSPNELPPALDGARLVGPCARHAIVISHSAAS